MRKAAFVLVLLSLILPLFSQDSIFVQIYEYAVGNDSLKIYAKDPDGLTGYDYRGEIEVWLYNNDVLISKKVARLSSSWKPYSTSENRIAIVMKDFDGGDNVILVVDFANDTMTTFRTDTVYVRSLAIHGNNLYYSTEKNSFSVAKIDLTNNEVVKYTNYYLPNANFFEYGDNVYAICDYVDKNNVFLISDNSLIQVNRDDFGIRNENATELELEYNFK